jgi:hypothetical protein
MLIKASLPAQHKQQRGTRTRLLAQAEYRNARLHPDAQNALSEQLAKFK